MESESVCGSKVATNEFQISRDVNSNGFLLLITPVKNHALLRTFHVCSMEPYRQIKQCFLDDKPCVTCFDKLGTSQFQM